MHLQKRDAGIPLLQSHNRIVITLSEQKHSQTVKNIDFFKKEIDRNLNESLQSGTSPRSGNISLWVMSVTFKDGRKTQSYYLSKHTALQVFNSPIYIYI